ncbi:ABR015Cp [Eremothecium gossypii ATCC 10895]|uniref:CENP-C homolog n=1 Tax=Eremothecium gossypii (strain ATCC 10895 / CBS 109.51 / FGSC 9923 / NRRL Y-1056) TaxID=284811 RepID=Q75DK6_EREGS|nr:ABR015Cp [Eremothecium gossypii ATCC 10895]AAS50785.1 ABR015Cp [Eremothecium gossypii ATCC 10895]AEY95074.1 FABR015Cp [Eremothecium gossypii FDAG1]
MDYMNLGITSRKTGLRVKQSIRRDEHSMENVDDFFAEDDESTVSSRRQSRRTSLLSDLKPHLSGAGAAHLFLDEDGFRIPSSAPQPRKQAAWSQRRQTETELDEYPPLDPGLPPIEDAFEEEPVAAGKYTGNGTPPYGTKYATRYDIPREEDSDVEESTIRLTPTKPTDDDYRDVPGLVDDNETTRDNTSFNTSEHALLEDEMEDDYEVDSADEEDGEYVDAVSRAEDSSASEHDDSDDSSASDADDAGLSRQNQRSKNGYMGDSDSEVLDSDEEYIQQQAKQLLPSGLDGGRSTGIRRSKRVRVPPLDYWRNEKVVYKRKSDKPVLEIDKIITYDQEEEEDEEEVRPKKKNPKTKARPYNYIPTGRPRGRPRKNAPQPATNNNEPNRDLLLKLENGEISNGEWLKHGILKGTVNISADKKGNEIVAFAPGLSQSEQVQESEDEKFTLAVMFDKYREMFASGMLILPVDGMKSVSDSYNAFITFYVVQGIVEVTLSENKFICTEGSSFQVPAFNTYAFQNAGHNEAKLFFVQVTVPENFDGSNGAAVDLQETSSRRTTGHSLSSSDMSLTTP